MREKWVCVLACGEEEEEEEGHFVITRDAHTRPSLTLSAQPLPKRLA